MTELGDTVAALEMQAKGLSTRVIVLTASGDEDEIFEAVRLGARGWCSRR